MNNTHNPSLSMKYQASLLICCALFPATLTHADEAVAPQEQVIVVQDQVLKVVVQQAEPVEKKADAEKGDEGAADEAKDGAVKTEKEVEAEDKTTEKELSEAELQKKMRELEGQLRDARTQFQQKANAQRDKVKKDALKALDDIKLPKNPTRKQCEAYVAELRKACEGRRSFSSSDPATVKLKELPPEHFDLLITEMTNRTSLRYYANYAMNEIEPEKMRDRFVKSIDENPNNIGIIVMHGWVEDVRPAIIEHINNADSDTTPAWFQAAVELDEPTLYPKLHEITTQSKYATQFINMLEMLPDYDMAHTVDVCWRRARDGKLSISYTSFAAKAAGYGNVDALESLISQLRSSRSYMSHSSSNVRRVNVLRFIDYRGSNTDIQKWFKDNKDKLVFDHDRKRFMLPEDF